MNRRQIVVAAKKASRRDARARRDPRFLRAMGVFLRAGLLHGNMGIEPLRGSVALSDVLWAGRHEPRFFELLPAVLIKKPGLVRSDTDIPADLGRVLAALRKNETPPDFRGLPGRHLKRWVPRLGHRNKTPTRSKTFRLRQQDVELLEELALKLHATETDVVRAGLRALCRESD